MAENFRSRMGDLRQEMDRIASQAEEMERVVQEQQVRLEEMDLLVRQRDEQLAEQQAHVEELESARRRHDEEAASWRAQLAAKEALLDEKDAALATLRSQLAEREQALAEKDAELAGLRILLAEREQALAAAPPAMPVQTFMERFAVLESLVNRQGESLITLRTLLQEEMARLHGRLDQMEARLGTAPPVTAPTPIAEVAPPAAPPLAAADLAPPAAAPLAAAAFPIPTAPPAPVPLAITAADPLQSVLQEMLDMLPAAALVGLGSHDGLGVEMLARREPAFAEPLEVELADLTAEAARVAAALRTGPLLTLAFQSGDDHLLLSPVGDGHFAYLLTPADSPSDLQHAQAVLLQAVGRINELD